MYRKIKLIIAVLLVMLVFQVSGQEWIVPAEKSAVTNPQDYILTNVKKGKDLFMLNCKSCHGDPGKNNALPLLPLPPDVVSEKMQLNSDGALFHKITSGKGSMPQFETVLSEDARWNVINFIRNYKVGRTALLIEKPPIKAQLWATIDEEDASVEVFAEFADKNGNFAKLVNAQVNFSAKKTFGNLGIGETFTDENGRAEFFVPESLIGDEEGLVNIVVALGEEYEAKIIVLENAKIATPKDVPKLIHPGVIWSTNDNMPLWLLASFIGIVTMAWMAIVYVIVQIVKIRKLSKF